MGISDCDWLSEDSKPREIERILVDAGIVEVIEEPVEGSGKSADWDFKKSVYRVHFE